MKNYYQQMVSGPTMKIVRWEETPNTYDYRGLAVKATLECGHQCILTGDAIQQREVICLPCGKVQKH